MRFYTRQHVHYCGIDLHARSLYLCILDQKGKTLVHKKLHCEREQLLKTLTSYREDLAVAVECLFCWYWVANLCSEQGIDFVLGWPHYRYDICMQLLLYSDCSDSTASTALWLDIPLRASASLM